MAKLFLLKFRQFAMMMRLSHLFLDWFLKRRNRIYFFFKSRILCTVWKLGKLSISLSSRAFWKKIRESNVFTEEDTKEDLISRIIFLVRENFLFFHTVLCQRTINVDCSMCGKNSNFTLTIFCNQSKRTFLILQNIFHTYESDFS